MWQKIKGFGLLLLIVLLSLVFALQFGGGQAEGCAAGGTTYVARVYDNTISKGDYEASRQLLMGFLGRVPAQQLAAMNLPKHIVDGIVDRTLLAHEARELGFEVSHDEVMKELVEDGTMRVTLGVTAPPYLPQGKLPFGFKDEDGKFNEESARRYIENGLRRTVSEFAAWQAEETLADRMRELLLSSVNVSDSEIWDAYVEENDRAQIKYARFSPSYYQRQDLKVTDAKIRAWMAEAENDARLETEYETNKHRYTDLEPQVRSRHILIKSPPNATDDAKAQARKKAEALRKRAVGGADFAKLAKENSEDAATAVKGGDLGFNPRGRMVKAFDDSQFELKIGEVSEVVETPFGFHVIKLEAKREGDVPKEEAKRELADRLYREDWANDQAKSAAADLLSRWRNAKDEEALAKQLEKDAEGAALAPKIIEASSFGRTDNPVPGLPAAELVKVVFDLKDGAEFPGEPAKVGREWLVFKLIDRERPDEDAYDEDTKAAKRESLESTKKIEALRLYLRQLRARAEAAGALRVNGPPTVDDGQS